MAYANGPPVEKVIVPIFEIPNDYEHLTLESVWEIVSKNSGDPKVVPELKEVHAPHVLFECIGVYQWFAYSFPNCKLYLW